MTQTPQATAKPIDTSVETLELAQALAQRLAIGHKDWHRLQANRPARAQEQAAAALVYLLNGNSEQALPTFSRRRHGWTDRFRPRPVRTSQPPLTHSTNALH